MLGITNTQENNPSESDCQWRHKQS